MKRCLAISCLGLLFCPVHEVGAEVAVVLQSDGCFQQLPFNVSANMRAVVGWTICFTTDPEKSRGGSQSSRAILSKWVKSRCRIPRTAYRVPLPLEAVKLLKKLPRLTGTELLFPGTKGQALSDMTMTAVMRRMKADAVPHGFRSIFRDWAGEKTNFPRELAEQALAHTLQNKVEAAYRRGDALEKRRQMMQEWAHFVLPH